MTKKSYGKHTSANNKRSNMAGNHLKAIDIEPLTQTQDVALQCTNNMISCGVAGTGKTFISLHKAFKLVEENSAEYKKVVIIRSTVPTRDIGFLPGDEHEKASVYEEPYRELCTNIFNRGDAYDLMKNKGLVEFRSTSFLRGLTMDSCAVVVDECQNMTLHELDTVITRVGIDCRIFFCGDFQQSDLGDSGFNPFMRILKEMKQFDIVEYTVDDIVRSEFVKTYIVAKLTLGIK